MIRKNFRVIHVNIYLNGIETAALLTNTLIHIKVKSTIYHQLDWRIKQLIS